MSGATVQRGNRETEKETEEFRFSVCSLSCQPHQTAAGSKVHSESWPYQRRKLGFASWTSGLFWGHTVGSGTPLSQFPISLPTTGGRCLGRKGRCREPSQLPSSRNRMQGKESVSKPNWQGKITCR